MSETGQLEECQQKRPAGRPREFDRDAALQAAMRVFWTHGYEGASLTELTEAMGISRPSLYATFGDKACLFRETVAAYTVDRDHLFEAALALPTAREVADHILRPNPTSCANPDNPAGCFLIQGALVGSENSDCMRHELATIRAQGTEQLIERFKRAKDEGDLPPEIDPRTLAQYVSSLSYGLSVQASSGVSHEQLARVVDLTMANWPS
jgi:AcrR family transcriptional regulator